MLRVSSAWPDTSWPLAANAVIHCPCTGLQHMCTVRLQKTLSRGPAHGWSRLLRTTVCTMIVISQVSVASSRTSGELLPLHRSSDSGAPGPLHGNCGPRWDSWMSFVD